MRTLHGLVILSLFFSACGRKGDTTLKKSNLLDMPDPGGAVSLSRKAYSSVGGRGATYGYPVDPSSYYQAPTTSGDMYSTTNYYSPAATNYGYPPFMNQYLSFADQVHWQRPNTTNVVKFGVGAATDSAGNPKYAYCSKWNIVIQSSQPISILAGSFQQGEGSATQSNATTINLQWSSNSSHYRGGVIFSAQGNYNPNVCQYPAGSQQPVLNNLTPYQQLLAQYVQQYYGAQNPYQSGYQGTVNGSYYAFPPPACGAQMPAQATLTANGSVTSCDGKTSMQVSFDYSSEMNNRSGVSPFQSKLIGTKYEIRARTINFDGQDWAGYTPPMQ